jgi:hypothetical protein
MMGRNLLIHNPTNEHTKYYRDYNLFWDQLTDELKKENKVIENRYFKEAHISRSKIYLKKRTKEYLELLECEYVIEDMDTGEFWILSVSEQISSCILDEKDNPYLQKVLYSQYIPDQIVHHVGENSSKYDPWIFFPQNTIDLEPYHTKRSEKKELIKKLFFKGKTDYRPIVEYINKDILSPNNMVRNHSYFNELIEYEICLSIGGTANGDLCYRDIECMALGIPLLRFDFVTTLNPPLIPNYHYISIPLQLDLPIVNDVLKDRLGNSEHAKLIEDKFHKIINNKNLLRYISENSRNYYESYLSPTARIKHTLNLLNHLK